MVLFAEAIAFRISNIFKECQNHEVDILLLPSKVLGAALQTIVTTIV